MRFSRLVSGTAAAALVGSITAAMPAPAQAGTVPTTGTATATTATPSKSKLVYGNTLSVSGTVTSDDDTAPVGTVTLYAARYSAEDPVFEPVASKETSGSYTFRGVEPRRNTYYGVEFTDDPEDASVYASSQSSVFAVGVARDVDTRNPRGLKIVGKVRPSYKHKPVVVQRKKGTRWVKFTVVRTSRRSKFAVTLKSPDRRGASFRYRITVPGNQDFLPYREYWTASTYRPVARVTTR